MSERIAFPYDGEILTVVITDDVYGEGWPFVEIVDADGAPYTRLSVNVPPGMGYLTAGQFFAKTYSENADIARALLDAGVFEPTGDHVESGYVQLPIWQRKHKEGR